MSTVSSFKPYFVAVPSRNGTPTEAKQVVGHVTHENKTLAVVAPETYSLMQVQPEDGSLYDAPVSGRMGRSTEEYFRLNAVG